MGWKTHRVFFFLTLNPPYSLLRTLKYCFLHVQLCGRRRLRPQRSGSRRRVHHHRGSRPPPGFMSTVGVHVHRQGSRPLSSPWRWPGEAEWRDGFNPPDVAGFQPGALMPGRLLRHPNKCAGNPVLRNRGCQAQGLSKWDHHQGAEDTSRITLFCPSLCFFKIF